MILEASKNYLQFSESHYNSNNNISKEELNRELSKPDNDVENEEDNYNYSRGACSSLFRQIDKKRILFYKMNSAFELKKAKKRVAEESTKEILKSVLFIYEYDEYIKSIIKEYDTSEFKHVIDPIQNENRGDLVNQLNHQKNSILNNFTGSINESPVVKTFIFTLRNFYGEEVAFYFAWVSYYVFILKYLAFYGIILFCIFSTMQFFMTEETIEAYNLWLTVPFTFFVVMVGKLFGEIWLDKEKVLSYKWGMEEYDLEIENSNLKGTVIYNNFLDIKIPLVDEKQAFYRKLVVWGYCILAYLFVIAANLVVFFIQFSLIGTVLEGFNNGTGGIVDSIFVYSILIVSPYAFLVLRNFFSRKFFKMLR